MKTKILQVIHKVFGYVVVVILCWLLFTKTESCNRNPQMPPTSVIEQPFDTIKLNDSLRIYKQLLYEAVSREELTRADTSGIINAAIKAGKVKPETVVNWTAVNEAKKRNVILSDSLGRMVAELDASIDRLKLSEFMTAEQIAKYEADRNNLYNARIKFVDSSKYRYLAGDFGLNGKLNIEKDITISEPYVILGEKKKLLNFGDPTYTVVVGDKNPDIKTTKLFSATYQPKKKIQPSIGPIFMTDGKSTNGGVGLNLKRGIISLSLGYKLF